MARVNTNPISLSISGRLGGMIYYRRNGRQYVRKAPRKPRTESALQAEYRMRFSAASGFYRALRKEGLAVLWAKAAEGKRVCGYNLVVARNIGAFDGEGRIADFRLLCPTEGELFFPLGMELRRGTEAGEWLLTWETESLFSGKWNVADRLQAVVMRDAETYAVKTVDCGGACRGDGEAVLRIPEEWRDYRHLYCFFCSQEDEASRSKYFCLTN